MQKRVLNEMAVSVKVLVITSLPLSILARRNHGNHALSDGLFDNGVTVVALVGQQVFGADPLDQFPSLRTICSGTLRNNDSERHTMRIHGQM